MSVDEEVDKRKSESLSVRSEGVKGRNNSRLWCYSNQLIESDNIQTELSIVSDILFRLDSTLAYRRTRTVLIGIIVVGTCRPFNQNPKVSNITSVIMEECLHNIFYGRVIH